MAVQPDGPAALPADAVSEGVSIFLIAVSTWLAPQPKLSSGMLINYGDRSYLEGNAEYHGYDLAPYFQRCAIASISPAHLGRIAWVWVAGAQPYGPCLVVDVMARHHAYAGIYINREVAELPRHLMEWFGAKNGIEGYVYFGACAPLPEETVNARPYRPRLKLDDGLTPHPIFWPYPEAQLPRPCPAPRWR